jgi:hypothetical protein
MSFILDYREKLVRACHPESRQESIELWHDIKGVKFGNVTELGLAGDFELAAYQIPEAASYLAIVRVECYTFTFVAAAPGFNQFGPPPPTSAFWEYRAAGVAPGAGRRIVPSLPIHILCDSEEMLFADGGQRISLSATLAANADANDRFVRTLVYGFMLSSTLADRLGISELTYFGDTI